MTISAPTTQILSTKAAHKYVGGSLIWKELLAAHPNILTPFRTTPQGWEYWHIPTIDLALEAAQLDGSLNQKKSS